MRTFRLDRRNLIGALLAVVAAAGVFALTRPDTQTSVMVAAADLPAGIPIEDLALSTREVADASGLVEASRDLDGLVLTAPLARGEPLLRSLLQPEERLAFPDALGLTVEAGHGAQGRLLPGDRVDVYVTRVERASGLGQDEEATERLPTEVVASEVLVIDVVLDDGGFASGGDVRLLLAVDDALAAAIVHATRAGEIDIVRAGR